MQVEGFFDDRSAERLSMEADARLVGRLSELAAFAKQHNIDVIFIALPVRHVARVMELLDELRDTTASIYYLPDIFVFDLIQARTSALDGIPVVDVRDAVLRLPRRSPNARPTSLSPVLLCCCCR